jgi:two-component system, OmpR family, alkaline phosphatase synthesis response regulator PhoP
MTAGHLVDGRGRGPPHRRVANDRHGRINWVRGPPLQGLRVRLEIAMGITAEHLEPTSGEARRALVLHDRPLVVDLIELTLNHGVFEVRAARDLAQAEAIIADWHPHLAVVDMDHDDSTELLARLGAANRLTKRVTPALGLTRRGDLKTKLRAFDLGVDDILTLPFSPEELLARAVVITRRATGIDRPLIPTIRLGEIEIDILSREVRAGTSVIHLSGIEQSLLYLLASRGGAVVTRDEILDAIWGTDFVSESNIVDRHIRSLRVKLQNDYRHPRFIATVPGQGYRFIPTFSNAGWAGEGEPGHRPQA